MHDVDVHVDESVALVIYFRICWLVPYKIMCLEGRPQVAYLEHPVQV